MGKYILELAEKIAAIDIYKARLIVPRSWRNLIVVSREPDYEAIEKAARREQAIASIAAVVERRQYAACTSIVAAQVALANFKFESEFWHTATGRCRTPWAYNDLISALSVRLGKPVAAELAERFNGGRPDQFVERLLNLRHRGVQVQSGKTSTILSCLSPLERALVQDFAMGVRHMITVSESQRGFAFGRRVAQQEVASGQKTRSSENLQIGYLGLSFDAVSNRLQERRLPAQCFKRNHSLFTPPPCKPQLYSTPMAEAVPLALAPRDAATLRRAFGYLFEQPQRDNALPAHREASVSPRAMWPKRAANNSLVDSMSDKKTSLLRSLASIFHTLRSRLTGPGMPLVEGRPQYALSNAQVTSTRTIQREGRYA